MLLLTRCTLGRFYIAKLSLGKHTIAVGVDAIEVLREAPLHFCLCQLAVLIGIELCENFIG